MSLGSAISVSVLSGCRHALGGLGSDFAEGFRDGLETGDPGRAHAHGLQPPQRRVIVALSAGSGMSADVFRRFHAMGVPLRNLYGSTEYGLVSAHWGGSYDPATMGRLLQVDAAVGEPLQVIVDDAGHDIWEVNVEEEYHEESTGSDGSASTGTGRDAPVIPRRVPS